MIHSSVFGPFVVLILLSHLDGLSPIVLFFSIVPLSALADTSWIIGKGPDWASPKDQHAWFADVTGAVIVRKSNS